MTEYRYRAYDRQGHAAQGVLSAPSPRAAAEALAKQGLVPTEIRPKNLGTLAGLVSRVSADELNFFYRQLWTLLRAGIPLQSGLVSLAKQTSGDVFRGVIQDLVDALEAGTPLSAAFERHAHVFPRLAVSLVKAGEASGKLDEVLKHLAEIGEFEQETRSKIKSALRYPILAFSSLALAFFMVVTFVIPKFMDIFNQFKTQLPLATRVLLAVHGAIRYHWLELIVLGAALLFLMRYALSLPKGRMTWDGLKLRVPVMGPLFLNLSMSRFTRIFSELLASGIPVLQALELTAETSSNAVVAKAVTDIHRHVAEGQGMSEPMRESGLFPPIVVQMVEVGEQSGRVEELLRHAADYYEARVNEMVKNFTTLIEPFFIFVLGFLVLILALGVFSPMWDLVYVVH